MKRLILILMLLLSFPFAYAETEIFSGKIITGTDDAIGGGIFRFTYDENSKKAFVETPAGGLIVDNGACKPNNIFRVCINSANFSHKNITTYVYYYEIDTTIYKLTGSLSASSKIASASLLQNEQAELTVTISNPTDFEITSIVFSYNLANFSVIEAKGCELNDNILQWKGSLQSRYDKACTAKISADRGGKYSLSGNLTYFNGFETEKKTTDALPITVLPKQLKVAQSVEKGIGIKEPFYFNISLQNMHSSEDIAGTSTITIPDHASLIKDIPSFEKNARVLKRSLVLKPGTGINYSFYLEKTSEGRQPIISRFSYAIRGLNEIIENSTFIDIITETPIEKLPEPEIKPQEPETKQENNETINSAATGEAQAANAISENKTTYAKIAQENKTAGQTIAAGIPKPKLLSKNILLVGASVIVSFLIIIVAIFRIKKGKKKDEVMEKLKDELNDELKP
ncbi:hypothetical protein HYX08_00610 [Candidatus Woesearchaeota archaeon]|nr:hypothetical protein [Candidatus Woesearchaeota archaeon]